MCFIVGGRQLAPSVVSTVEFWEERRLSDRIESLKRKQRRARESAGELKTFADGTKGYITAPFDEMVQDQLKIMKFMQNEIDALLPRLNTLVKAREARQEAMTSRG